VVFTWESLKTSGARFLEIPYCLFYRLPDSLFNNIWPVVRLLVKKINRAPLKTQWEGSLKEGGKKNNM
jgi:hypothetical protein